MDEQATFETRAVLPPRRARGSRIAILVPVLALLGIAWAGLSGHRPAAPSAAAVAAPSRHLAAAAPTPSAAPRPAKFPARVLGFDVHRLERVQAWGLGRDALFAVSGWYVATAIGGCPPVAEPYRQGILPLVRGGSDELANCDRAGVLYASRPGGDDAAPANSFLDNQSGGDGLVAVAATMVTGVVAPVELELVGGVPTPVVFLAHFVGATDACRAPVGCTRELVVDHVAWTPAD